MFQVLALDDGLPTPGYYVETPDGELCAVFNDQRGADLLVAILNFSIHVKAIEE